MAVLSSRLLALFVVAGFGGAAAQACHLSGDVSGGDLTDAGQLAIQDRALCGPAIPDPPGGVGNTWAALYRDYFGPTGQPGSCTFKSNCHGRDALADPKSGANDGAGIQCFDEETCYQSWIKKGLVADPNDPKSAAAAANLAQHPDKANAFSILRTCVPPTTDGGDPQAVGIMPKEPNATFSQTAVTRIKGWISQGIPRR